MENPKSSTSTIGPIDIFRNFLLHVFGPDGYDALLQGRYSLAVVLGGPLGWIANFLQVFGPALSNNQGSSADKPGYVFNFALYGAVVSFSIALLLFLPVYLRNRYCRICAFPCVIVLFVACILLALFGVQKLTGNEQQGLNLSPTAWRDEFNAWGKDTFPTLLQSTNERLEKVISKMDASDKIKSRILEIGKANYPYAATPEEILGEIERGADITYAVAAGYYYNLVRHMIDKSISPYHHSFIILRPNSIRGINEQSARLVKQLGIKRTSLGLKTHPRGEVNIGEVFFEHDEYVFYIDFPTPLDALKTTIPFKTSLERNQRNTESQTRFEQILIDTFFLHLENFIELDDHVDHRRLEILTEGDLVKEISRFQ